jgi:hypothetical protein
VSEGLFRVWFKMCGGENGQNAFFVFGIKCVFCEGSELLFCVFFNVCGVRGVRVFCSAYPSAALSNYPLFVFYIVFLFIIIGYIG